MAYSVSDLRKSQSDFFAPYDPLIETDNAAAFRLAISEALVLILTLESAKDTSVCTTDWLLRIASELSDESQNIGSAIG